MARRLWIATIGASLCAGLLPACAHLPWSRERLPVVKTPEAPKPLPVPEQPVQVAPPTPRNTPYPSWHADPLPQPATPVSVQRDYYPRHLGEPEPQEHPGEKEPTKPDASVQEPHPTQTIAADLKPESSKEPLLEALERFLKDRPDEALGYLQQYDERSQELFIRLLPVLAQLTHKNLAQLEPGEVAALSDQLQGLMVSLRYRADLGIDTLCFCSRVERYGVFTALPADHVFRPGTDSEPGEQVQLYAELRNFCMETCGDGYEARLSSCVEIQDKQTGKVWPIDFKDDQRRLHSRTPRHDHFNNYNFYVPSIPPGTYLLTLQVRDLTRPDAPRLAKKSVEFRVGP